MPPVHQTILTVSFLQQTRPYNACKAQLLAQHVGPGIDIVVRSCRLCAYRPLALRAFAVLCPGRPRELAVVYTPCAWCARPKVPPSPMPCDASLGGASHSTATRLATWLGPLPCGSSSGSWLAAARWPPLEGPAVHSVSRATHMGMCQLLAITSPSGCHQCRVGTLLGPQ